MKSSLQINRKTLNEVPEKPIKKKYLVNVGPKDQSLVLNSRHKAVFKSRGNKSIKIKHSLWENNHYSFDV